ncbi:MAG TPA: hypothetical protein VLA92_05165 [Candidatus Saccharimonadales bacterium]|nr:hypothetical protein [Candidatus Saccharimonadales bacterium]
MFSKKKPSTPPVERARVRSSDTPSRGAVFSYHANRNVRMGSNARQVGEQQETPNRPKRPPVDWHKQLPAIGALAAILAITILSLHLSSNAKVEVVGGDDQVFMRDHKTYEAAAQAAFSPVLNGNKLTVNADKVARDLQKQFPELKAVSVSLPVFGNQPIVYIQPVAPKMILVSKDGMYLLDADGRALITGNQVPDLDALHIPVVNDQSGLPITLGKVALPKGTVSFITQVAGQLQAKGLKITTLTLPVGSTELQARLDGVGYYVKFNLHGNAREEAGSYLAVKAKLESMHKTPAEYVDVRVENKAYYK